MVRQLRPFIANSYRLKDKRKSGIIGQQIPAMQAED